MGYVPGLIQSSDRAELCAVVSVVAWQCFDQVSVHLWIDSMFVVDNLAYLLQTGTLGDWAHHDLWSQLQMMLQHLGSAQLIPHWVPSHLDPALLSDAFEDWICCWNDRIDAAATSFSVPVLFSSCARMLSVTMSSWRADCAN
eukprot:s396_g34.t1